MTWSIAVTFETPTHAAPATVRVEIDARSVTAAVRKASAAARCQMLGRRWQSLVILVERARSEQALHRSEASARRPGTAELIPVCELTDSLCCSGVPK
jgi:hypothetical protein